MKKIFVLSVLTSVAMICACQKKDSATEEQLTQPKTEVGSREEALAERLNSLEEKVNRLDQSMKELAEKEKATINARTSPADVQSEISDPAQIQAEKERMIQQLSTMMPDPAQIEEAEREREIQRAQKLPGLGQLQGQQQLRADELEKQRQQKLEAAGISPTPQ